MVRRTLLAFPGFCGMAALLLVGCQKDEIQSYHTSKEQPVHLDLQRANRPSLRMLTAIFPHGDRTWFFKLLGPESEVDQHKEEFDRFIQSVRFKDQAKEPVTWTVPDGWRSEPGVPSRYATFRPGTKDSSLILTVVPLGAEAGSLLANVNRWRGQLGLPDVTEAELSKLTSELKVDGVAVTIVDMTSPGMGNAAENPPFAGGRKPPAAGFAPGGAARPSLKYAKPDGWEETPDRSGMRLAGFRVSEGNQSAEITIIPLPGRAGSLLDNVNRWREQISLEPITEAQLRQVLREIEVAGAPAPYLDLLGPEAAGSQRQRILGVMVVRGDQSIFFKMKGSAELVGKQKPAFEAFLKSVKFAGGNDG